ncbi:MAG: phosphotransferase enzyme family protein [Candidatus Thorarchaeota archaeon]
MTEDWLRKALADAADLYDFQVENLESLAGGYENRMFGFKTPTRKVVIRVTPPGHKSVREVKAEIDWISYLRQNGAPVVEPIESNRGKLVEASKSDFGEIPVVCFRWAAGEIIRKEQFSAPLFQIWGRSVGKMHALTKDYKPIIQDRIQWFDDEYLSRNSIPTDQTRVLERFDALISHFKELPHDRDSYGLIHEDVHHANLFYDGNDLTVLDFDDCQYGFFVFDIANALGFSIWEKPDSMSNRQFADHYLEHFMKGYEEENHLDESWIEHLPYALKLFEFIHYNAFNLDYDLAGQGSFLDIPVHVQNILKRYRHSIEQNLPYIENTFCPYR